VTRRAALAAAVVAALLAAAAPARAADPPPVVVVVFDALPTLMLQDGAGRIDARRFPHFAALAARSTWYRNASTVHDSTFYAVPALLDGKLPVRGRGPSAAEHPESLFTLLRDTHEIHSVEPATQLCPPDPCGARPFPSAWQGLLAPRPALFRRAVAAIGPSARPALHVIHTLLPHEPLMYLPSGARYDRPGLRQSDLDEWPTYHSPWLSRQAHQRHMLQARYADRLLGELLARLRSTGLLDRAVLVVTADHGASFRRKPTPAPPFRRGELGWRRSLTAANAHEVAAVPLFVKRPGQTAGAVDDRWARSIDVVPTIAELAGVRTYPLDGASLAGPAAAPPRELTIGRRSGAPLRIETAALARNLLAAARRQAAAYGAGQYAIGPHRSLLGRAVRSLPRLRRTRLRANVVYRGRFRAVKPRSFVPALVFGRLRGERSRGRPVAIAVNGRVAATSPTFRGIGGGRVNYSAILPPSAFRPGRNRVRVYEIVPGRRLRLRALG
jgi:hypothetical protein